MEERIQEARENLLGDPEDIEGETIQGHEFSDDFDFAAFIAAYQSMGMQGSRLGDAIHQLRHILEKKQRKPAEITVFLGYTSNMVSSGNREIIRYLVEHNLVDVLVTTAGGIEEDFLKTETDFIRGQFNAAGDTLREHGVNRIGNIYASNTGYIWFEDFIQPILQDLYEEQDKHGEQHTPSHIIRRMGETIEDPESVYYWAAENNIPVFCPTFTDGAIGSHLFYVKNEHNDFSVDMAGDIQSLNQLALDAEETAILILGAGPAKHHVCQANILRGGTDHAIYINTKQGFDGSDGGANPDEAVSWGKISKNTENAVKVHCDATIAFPLLVAGALHAGGGNK